MADIQKIGRHQFMWRSILILSLIFAGMLIYLKFSRPTFFSQWLPVTTNRMEELSGPLQLVRNYIPDIFWAIAVSETAALCRYRLGKFYFYLLLTIPVFSEWMQLTGRVPGTFDWCDLSLYLVVLIYYLPPVKIRHMKKLSHLLFFSILGINLVFIYGSAVPSHTTRNPTVKPGFYGVTAQWNGSVGDVDGEVGHRLYVSGPRAKCISCTNCPAGSWSSNYEIVSGSLPPGLSFGSGFDISGIPTERGHWVIKIKLYNISCNNLNYDGCCSFTQELRFHITGTGRVNN